jgi:hypothetical protein
MDRNIITAEVAAAHNRARAAEYRKTIERYVEKPGGLEAGLQPGVLGGELPIGLEKPDAWYDRIVKFVPGEAIGAYLALDKGTQAFTPEGSERVGLLALALVIVVAFNVAYLMRIAKVTSVSQVAISSLALLAYVYVTGGVFAAVDGLARPEVQLFVLIVTGLLLTFFKPPDAEKPGST